jgi:hypothetical protein
VNNMANEMFPSPFEAVDKFMDGEFLPPNPMELFKRAGGPNFRDMALSIRPSDKLPIPAPDDIQKIASGFLPSPADVGKLGQEMVSGGITDKVLIASAIITPPLLVAGVVVTGIGVILLAAGGMPK